MIFPQDLLLQHPYQNLNFWTWKRGLVKNTVLLSEVFRPSSVALRVPNGVISWPLSLKIASDDKMSSEVFSSHHKSWRFIIRKQESDLSKLQKVFIKKTCTEILCHLFYRIMRTVWPPCTVMKYIMISVLTSHNFYFNRRLLLFL